MNILLLDPNYKSSYPPIGLMKLSVYHKEHRNDFVWFAKGKLPELVSEKAEDKLKRSKYYSSRHNIPELIATANEAIRNKLWDRVYVTTLFTFEWDKTIAAIEYAKSLVGDVSKVFVGGILATLMPEELEAATGIKPMTGLLTDSVILGFDDHVNIDLLTPDYSILDMIEHHYPMSEHYLLKATRGCGMKCSFCAVQTLEPDCVDYISLKDMVNEIDEKYGKRLNLVLMDNNILKSRHLEQIMQDIVDLGYGCGAIKINPLTGKENHVYVDFNQGLDMNFITEQRMELISRLSVRPVRIAFDHVKDKGRYMKAMELADRYNIKILSNYLLYNTVEINGKGKMKSADTPKDLYERLIINMELQERFNLRRKGAGISPVVIYSFPMKFIPLKNKDRDFVGTYWSKKTLRAFRRLINPARGCIYAVRDAFEKTFGSTYDEFYKLLQAPALYLEKRGHHNTEEWTSLWQEWESLYDSLSNQERQQFETFIADNDFSAKKYLTIESSIMRKLYVHYSQSTNLLTFLREVKAHNAVLFYELRHYITSGCRELLSVNIGILSSLSNARKYHSELLILLSEDTVLVA